MEEIKVGVVSRTSCGGWSDVSSIEKAIFTHSLDMDLCRSLNKGLMRDSLSKRIIIKDQLGNKKVSDDQNLQSTCKYKHIEFQETCELDLS